MKGNEDWERGYRQGETERQALAVMNSELRSQVRELKKKIKEMES